MSTYYFSKIIDKPVDVAEQEVREALQLEGFGVLTEIDVAATFKKKLDVDYPAYKILGACNPQFAYQALEAETKIGAMLPCNVIVREIDSATTEVAAVDPVSSMQAVVNADLEPIAGEVREKLQRVVASL